LEADQSQTLSSLGDAHAAPGLLITCAGSQASEGAQPGPGEVLG